MKQPNVAATFPFSARFWGLCIATGIAAGLGAIVLMATLRAVQHLAWTYSAGDFQSAVVRATYARRVIVLAVCGLVTTATIVVLRRFFPARGGLTEAIWFHSGAMPFGHSVVRGFASMTIVALGASLGREEAPKEIAAACASLFARTCSLSKVEMRILVACGAGAGMAAVYNVPLGGALFAVEVLLGSLDMVVVIPALLVSSIATAVTWLGLPNAPTYAVPPYSLTVSTLVWSIPFGALAGLAAVVFLRAVIWASARKPRGLRAYFEPLLLFTALGALACAFPQILGNGKDPVQQLFTIGYAPMLVALLLIAKFVATTASLRTGAPGGLFTPTMAIGSLFGAFVGNGWSTFWPDAHPAVYAIVGAGALLAATTKAPISSIVLVLELTYSIDGVMVPLVIASIVATIVAHRIDPRSTYSGRIAGSRDGVGAATERATIGNDDVVASGLVRRLSYVARAADIVRTGVPGV